MLLLKLTLHIKKYQKEDNLQEKWASDENSWSYTSEMIKNDRILYFMSMVAHDYEASALLFVMYYCPILFTNYTGCQVIRQVLFFVLFQPKKFWQKWT